MSRIAPPVDPVFHHLCHAGAQDGGTQQHLGPIYTCIRGGNVRSPLKLLLFACLGPSLLVAQTRPAAGASPSGAQVDPASFSVPHYVRFSGTAAGSANTTTSARFALYSNQDGGAPLWMETQNVLVDAS